MRKHFLSFTKMAGAGNDFILIDNRSGIIGNGSRAAGVLCNRKFSVGGDGLILLEKSKKFNLRMRIFNPDGSEAEMCGNGVRCLALFAVRQKAAKKNFSVETLAGEVKVSVSQNLVKARMTDPRDFRLNLSVPVNGKKMRLHSVNTGVPHVVHFVSSFSGLDVDGLGRLIRRHSFFAPKGTNANFVKIAGKNSIEVKTYERGVESETLACGTGSSASAIMASALYGLGSPVSVTTSGGEKLTIYFSKSGESFHDVFLEGNVKVCFEGRVML